MRTDAVVGEPQQEAPPVVRVSDLVQQFPAQQPGDHLGDGGPVEPDALPHRALVQPRLGGQGVEYGELGRGDLLRDHGVPQQMVRLLKSPGQMPGMAAQVDRGHGTVLFCASVLH